MTKYIVTGVEQINRFADGELFNVRHGEEIELTGDDEKRHLKLGTISLPKDAAAVEDAKAKAQADADKATADAQAAQTKLNDSAGSIPVKAAPRKAAARKA